MRTTIILLPASVVAKLAPTFVQSEKGQVLSLPPITPFIGYWKRLALATSHAVAETWGHARFHP